MVFQLFILLFINKVICISKAVLRYSGVLEPKAMVIYNPGPDMALFDPRNHFPKVPQLPQAGTIIVSIGKLLPVKGHEHFLRMARIIESKRPGQCRFVIVGNTAPGREDYPAFIRRNIVEFGLSESVFILDTIPHDQVPAILSRAAIVTHLPNWQEGLGGVVLEAMAMEVPVVAFNCGGIAECFTNGISGILVDQFDVDAAARGVEQLLDDVVLRKKMGAQARTELLSKFSYQRHFSAVESVYRSCSLQ
jgi:phosphatidylinositol alpha-1,6-mannosyltransferase